MVRRVDVASQGRRRARDGRHDVGGCPHRRAAGACAMAGAIGGASGDRTNAGPGQAVHGPGGDAQLRAQPVCTEGHHRTREGRRESLRVGSRVGGVFGGIAPMARLNGGLCLLPSSPPIGRRVVRAGAPANRVKCRLGAARCQRAVAQLGSALDWGSRGRRFKSCQPDRKRPSQRRFRRDPRPPLGLFRGPRTATRFGAGVPGASPEDFLCCGLTASQRSRSAVVGVCTEARVRTPSVRPTVMARMAWRGCQPGPAAFDADARGSAIMALE